MSAKGRIEVKCPGERCEPFEADVWTLVNLELSPELKEQLIAGELNLIACEECHGLFHAENLVVVRDPRFELIAFVFPESYQADAKRWVAKMDSDFEKMRAAMGEMAPDYRPIIYFGMENFRQALEQELLELDEQDIAKFLIKSLGLEAFIVRPSFARERHIPRVLPSSGAKGGRHERVVKGLEVLLKENPLLESYQRCLKLLKKEPGLALPPAKKRKTAKA